MKIFPRLFVLMAFVLCGVLYGTITPAQSDKDIGVVLGKALTAVASGNFTTAETLRDSLKDKDARALILWSQLRAGGAIGAIIPILSVPTPIGLG